MSNQKSPMEKYWVTFKVWALLCVLAFGGCAAGFKLDEPYTEKTSHNATLELAYSSMQKCGKHEACEVFRGRFKLAEDGKMYDREIDGFFYHNFVDGGRKPMAAYITLSKNDKGIETPGYIQFLMFLGILGVLIAIAGGMGLLFGHIDVEYEEKEWQRRQSRKTSEWRY